MDKLLIVDKNEQIVDLISKLLSAANYDTYTANTGKTAIAKIKVIKPDLIIMDTDLNDMSGFDVCKILKSTPETKYILVLMLMSIESKDYILRSLHSGADDYIVKLFDSTILLSKVRSLLRIKNLSDRLNTQYLELKEKNELIDFQLKMARQVQRSIIKRIDLQIGNMHIISRYMPALEIGGDFYNVLKLDDNHVGILMGDVSGHGISAALLTSMLIVMFNTVIKKHFIPNELLTEINNQFYSIFENTNIEMYACVFYALLDIDNLKIVYSNAGLAFPIYVNSNTNEAKELDLGGMPLGLIQNTVYENKSLNYSKGDLLFLHTDGLSDLFYKDTPNIFTTKLKDILESCLNDSEEILEDIIELVLAQFYKYDENKKFENDDISIILCKL